MKATLTLLALVFAANAAQAASPALPTPAKRQYGAQCGLTDGFDSDSFEEIGDATEIALGGTFTDLEKQQIIQAVQSLAGEAGETAALTLDDSIKYLNESSEGGEAYLQTNVVNGVDYTVLLYYPGGNPVGIVFEKGTLTEIAHIEDSDVVCAVKAAK